MKIINFNQRQAALCTKNMSLSKISEENIDDSEDTSGEVKIVTNKNDGATSILVSDDEKNKSSSSSNDKGDANIDIVISYQETISDISNTNENKGKGKAISHLEIKGRGVT